MNSQGSIPLSFLSGRWKAFVLAASLLSLCVPFSCAGDVFGSLSSLDKDKYVHFGAGVLASHVSYPVFRRCTRDRKRALWYSLALTAALSAGKELSDIGATGFDCGDLAAGVLGGLTIVVVEFD